MKLRIRGNSLRLRLSQRDVNIFGKNGRVEDGIQFGAAVGGKLTYAIEAADIPKLKCEFIGQKIHVYVPRELAKIWVETELVGMEHLDTTDGNNQIRILIEKDFKCLHVRINEDEIDAFPHPQK